MDDHDESSNPASHGFEGQSVQDEHFVPGEILALDYYIEKQDLTAVHHLARYVWAAAYLGSIVPAPETILDLGCGSGYGTSMLAAACPASRVSGIDYDSGAVRSASARFSRENLEYRVGDPLRWASTIGSDEFSAIVSFDVIEHVAHREIFMESLVDHLHPRGRLLFSTPCGMPENNLNPGWHFHRVEYGTASLFDFLQRYFRDLADSASSNFPERTVFEAIHERGVPYALTLNPVICSEPIRISNPYRTR